MAITRRAVDAFISDRVTMITECNIRDLSAEFPAACNWVSGYGLMVIFVNHVSVERRPFALHFVRRAEMAFAEYSSARHELDSLVSGSRGRWSPYFRALYHLEAAMGQLYQAYDSSRKALDKTLFEGKDGSPLSRLNLIYNASKHQLAGTDQPTWITNDGIESSNAKLSFLEMEELLCWCGRIATTLTSTNGKGEQGKPGG